MKKPKQKRIIKQCLENIELNFSELIDAIIWYEQHNMDDWAFEIIGEIERLQSKQILNLLFQDLLNRKNEDFTIYLYKKLWWSLFNTESEEINKSIIDFCQQSTIGTLLKDNLHYWLNELDEDSNTKFNIRKILN